ncbi:hypothetical protein NFHSH190041_19860 [Shewanella sp. NFH-SH190041]|uniref:hypothetical protein n=1 Tax=Shewanella sp. NFH-SH190041 TaxID=2950245 RepID=UPI0021C337C3|nr:hypothetical protein [Shewanella sp. NFH-SH190041]BDM64534.1 hypothetical protein NFHSH190041_19860 [Shewanella sp. NFH-SH190041]
MITHFLSLPDDHYPAGGCAMLARDAWQMLYCISDLPLYIDQFVTVSKASGLMSSHQQSLMQQIEQPEHGCLITGVQGTHWHCGIYSTEQVPGYIIHAVGGKVKIEPLHKFKQRFDSVEFYKCLR